MKTRLLNPVIVLIGILALSACGGGGGGSSTSGGGSGGGGGTVNPPPVLPTIDDSNPITQTTRIANFQIGDTGTPSISQNASITLDAGYLTAINGTVEIFGQSVSITNGRGTVNGQEVRVEIDASSAGSFAVPVAVSSYGPDLDMPANPSGESAFVVGQETGIGFLNAQSGSVTYRGGFVVNGVLQIGGVEELAELEGDITVNVSFAGTDTASATLQGAYDPASGGPQNVTLNLATTTLSGNGFSGALSCTTSGCSSNGSAIDATFYGPEAQEVGGVLAVDITLSGEVFEGAGTFLIDQ